MSTANYSFTGLGVSTPNAGSENLSYMSSFSSSLVKKSSDKVLTINNNLKLLNNLNNNFNIQKQPTGYVVATDINVTLSSGDYSASQIIYSPNHMDFTLTKTGDNTTANSGTVVVELSKGETDSGLPIIPKNDDGSYFSNTQSGAYLELLGYDGNSQNASVVGDTAVSPTGTNGLAFTTIFNMGTTANDDAGKISKFRLHYGWLSSAAL